MLLYKNFFFIEPLSGTGGNHTIDLHPTKEEEKMCPTQIFSPNLHRHELQTALCFFHLFITFENIRHVAQLASVRCDAIIQ